MTAIAVALLAAVAPKTVMVVPFATEPRELRWAGMVAAELLVARAEANPASNVLSVRQLNTVLKRRDVLFEDVADGETAARIGAVLGATQVVIGRVARKGSAFEVTATLVEVNGAAASASEQVSAERIEEAVAKLGLLASPGAPPPPRAEEAAWAATGRCLEALLPQPLGPRARPVLPADALAQAKSECEAAVAAAKDLGLARAGLAIVRVNEGDAKAGLEEARASQARGFVSLGVLAEYYARMQLGDATGAVAALEAAVAAHPGFLHARGYAGEHHNEHKAYAKGLKAFEAYLKRCPEHPWVMSQIGYAKARLGMIDASVQITRAAAARDPENPEMAIELASRLIDAKQLDEAATALAPALSVDPPRPLAFLRLGYIKLLQGKLDEAEEPLKRALKDAWREDESKTRGTAHFDLARIYARQGKLDEAVLELQDSRAEGYPKTLSCEEPDLVALAADKRFTEICTPDAKPAKKKR